jgi:hypothetical protein
MSEQPKAETPTLVIAPGGVRRRGELERLHDRGQYRPNLSEEAPDPFSEAIRELGGAS